MSNFMKSQRKTSTPEQLVRSAQRALVDHVEDTSSASTKVGGVSPAEDLCNRLSQLKLILYGGTSDGDKSDVDEEKAMEVSQRIQDEGLLLQLIDKLEAIPFEARKDTAQIFNNLMHKNIADFVTYVSDHFYVVKQIAHGYTNTDIALNCGSMLRECIRYEELTRQILLPEETFLWDFFDSYVHLPNFDVASDAFNTLRDILVSSRNKQIASDFLEQRYTKVFQKYEILLESGNYVTRRRSLKLLGELLLDRSNFNVMMRFIASEHNLQVVMNLLRDKSANIQFEAFHVFKVFVANPNKPAKICLILYNNKQKLCNYLANFHQDKEGDDSQFSEEKKLLIATLQALERPTNEELRREMSRKKEENKEFITAAGEEHENEQQHEKTEPPLKRENKGFLRDALANCDLNANNNPGVGGSANVILDESDIQPTGYGMPTSILAAPTKSKEVETQRIDNSSMHTQDSVGNIDHSS